MSDRERWPDAVVFDCDGTLADTESPAERAWEDVLATRGYRPTAEDFADVIGLPFGPTFDHFADRAELGDAATLHLEIRARYLELLTTDLALYDDAVTTARALAEAGVPVGVASSSTRRHVHHVLDVAGLSEVVRVVVSADDVTEHKPLPMPYLTAIELLGAPAARAAAVEDTAVGVAAARAAGLWTVAVRRRATSPVVLADAHRVVESLDVRLFRWQGDRDGGERPSS